MMGTLQKTTFDSISSTGSIACNVDMRRNDTFIDVDDGIAPHTERRVCHAKWRVPMRSKPFPFVFSRGERSKALSNVPVARRQVFDPLPAVRPVISYSILPFPMPLFFLSVPLVSCVPRAPSLSFSSGSSDRFPSLFTARIHNLIPLHPIACRMRAPCSAVNKNNAGVLFLSQSLVIVCPRTDPNAFSYASVCPSLCCRCRRGSVHRHVRVRPQRETRQMTRGLPLRLSLRSGAHRNAPARALPRHQWGPPTKRSPLHPPLHRRPLQSR
jgi:hypothetical protein